MSSSSSNASSSDLYSPSDNPELVPAHPARNPSPVHSQATEDYIAFSTHPNDQLEEPTAQDGEGTVDFVTREADSRGLPEHNQPNGFNNSGHNKRKRDKVEDSHLDASGRIQNQYFPTRVDVELSDKSHGEEPPVSASIGDTGDIHDSGSDDGPQRKRQLIHITQGLPESGNSCPDIPEDWSRISRSKLPENHIHFIEGMGQSQSSGLPAEIWQHIFSFVPPVFLGRLLRVSQTFHACLTQATGEHSDQAKAYSDAVRPVSANSVWAASRKRFAPGLPKPLRGLQELEMWRLLRGRPCQTCGETKVQNFGTSSESPLESGPGDKGVRVLWPFGIRMCGSCLRKCSEKESALYVSSDFPYFLLPALPFAFVTATNHFVSNAALQGMAHLPPLKMEKHYYKPHIEDIKRRLADAKALGAPSVEEWMKGLPSEGKERQDDAVRWEQWEARGGLKKVNAKAPAKQLSTPAISKLGPSIIHNKLDTHLTPGNLNMNIPLPAKPSVDSSTSTPPQLAKPTYPAAPVMTQFQPPWTPTVSYPDGFAQRAPGALPQSRPERNIRDVNEAKAIRKAEIERRCQGLSSPLLPSILTHMESFQAAIQISQPLTEHAWEVLKPRLLAQRPYAERKEKEKIQQDQLLEEEYKQRRQQETQLKETKEALDREWDTVQAPVRNRIGALADEIIAENWSNGDAVSKETSPKFAADVLLYVRERFYADIGREDEEARITGQPVKVDQPNGPPTRKLILENMKWLFDTKIKTLTENYQKELFLCNGCEGNFKFYGFEGVIQHYAAKHTSSLSMGNVVVHWRAEWPEHPPFNPNPTAAKSAYYKIPTPVSIPGQGLTNGDQQPQPYHPYSQGPDANANSHHPQQGYHNVQAPTKTYSLADTSPQQGAPYSYPAEQVHYPYAAANAGNVPMTPSSQEPSISYSGPPQATYTSSQQVYNAYPQSVHGQPAPGYASHYQNPQYPPYAKGQEYGTTPGPSGQYYGPNGIVQQPNNYAPRPVSLHPSGLTPDVYQKQLDELAKHAREVWFGTGGIKDIPQSVRIYVVIHHAASRFAASFSIEPTLAMFIDGLDNHPKMRPVRSLNGLACKTCVHASSSAGQQPYPQYPVADRKLYTLPHLLNHFRTAHLETALGFPEHAAVGPIFKPDWKRDMIELPDLALIGNLIDAQGADDTKLGLIASVFPEAFPNPLPALGRRPGHVGPVPIYRATSSATNPPRAAGSITNPNQARTGDIPTNYQSFATPVSAVKVDSSRAPSSEPPGEDEYDPHRPAYLGRIVRPGTDARLKEYATSTPSHTEQSSTYPYAQSDAQYHGTNGVSAHHGANGPHAGPRNEDLGHYKYAEHPSGRASTHESPVEARLNGGFTEVYAASPARQTYRDPNQHSYNSNNGIAYQRLKENINPNGHQRSTRYTNQITSPSEAADQFLRSFSVSKANNSGLHEQDAGSHSSSTRPNAANSVDHDRMYNESAGRNTWNGVKSGVQQVSGNYPMLDSIRAASLITKAVEDSASSRNLMAKGHQDDEYHPPTHVQLSAGTSRVGQSPQPYDSHSSARHGVAHQQYAPVDISRPREDRASSYHQVRELQYRSRSRSPRPSQVEMGFYRSRSPRPEGRNESVYHVISPSSRTEHQAQRVVNYDYPAHEQYEYIDDRAPHEDRYGRRVEYVPLRYEEPRPAETSRYVLAPRYEEPAPPPPGYVRVEQGYGGEQFYERDGQLYRAGPSTQAYAHEYRY